MRYRHCILGFRALFALLAALIICSVSLYFANIFLWFNRENPAWFKETFFVYWIVHSIIQVVVAWVFFSRLNFFPLKPRSPILLGISAFANYLLCSWALFRLFQEKARFSCRVVKWLINIGYPCMILPYFLRAYRLTKLFDESNTHNQGRLRSFSIDNDEDTNRKRLLSRENGDSFSIRSDSVEIYSEESNSRVTQSRLLVYLAFMLSPFIILAIVDSFLNVGMLPIFGSELSCSTYQLVSDTTARIFWIVVHYSESFALLFFVRKLRNVWDEFNIVWELKLTCLSCFVNALALSFFIGAKTRNSFLNEESLVYITRGVFLFSISIVWPLYKTYTPNMLNFPDRLMVGSLREVLHDESCFPYFQQFCSRIGYLNDLRFWAEVEMFRDLFESPPAARLKIIEESRRIFSTYCNQNSAYFVPLTPEIPLSFESTLSHLGHDASPESLARLLRLLNRAQSEIFSRLDSSPFEKFLTSPECESLLLHLARRERVVQRLFTNQAL